MMVCVTKGAAAAPFDLDRVASGPEPRLKSDLVVHSGGYGGRIGFHRQPVNCGNTFLVLAGLAATGSDDGEDEQYGHPSEEGQEKPVSQRRVVGAGASLGGKKGVLRTKPMTGVVESGAGATGQTAQSADLDW